MVSGSGDHTVVTLQLSQSSRIRSSDECHIVMSIPYKVKSERASDATAAKDCDLKRRDWIQRHA